MFFILPAVAACSFGSRRAKAYQAESKRPFSGSFSTEAAAGVISVGRFSPATSVVAEEDSRELEFGLAL